MADHPSRPRKLPKIENRTPLPRNLPTIVEQNLGETMDEEEEKQQQDVESHANDELYNGLFFSFIIMMHEMERNLTEARLTFELWISREQLPEPWLLYIDFETRHDEVERARALFERFVELHPRLSSWNRYAEFEFRYGDKERVRACCHRALVNFLSKKLVDVMGLEYFLMALARFEENHDDLKRARNIYMFALNNVPKKRVEQYLYKKILEFEERNKEGGENSILQKRRLWYEAKVKRSPMNYHAWYEYLRFEEFVGSQESIKKVYKRATANVPQYEEKQYWRPYVYLSILYAFHQEFDAKDIDGARKVYTDCIGLIPHKKFSFSKVWLLAADFEIRQLNIEGARKILGDAIKNAPKNKIFEEYINMETNLGEVNGCRSLNREYVQFSPDDSSDAWMKCAKFEMAQNETERARFIFELAISQPALRKSLLLWKAYIDFEVSTKEYGRARKLFERLLKLVKNVIIWKSYAYFEVAALQEPDDIANKESSYDNFDMSPEEEDIAKRESHLRRARRVFERTLDYYRCFDYNYLALEHENEQVVLAKEWLTVERFFGDLGDTKMVLARLPTRLRRRVQSETDQYARKRIRSYKKED